MALLPSGYRKTQYTHRRDTRANQPLATTVLTGTLYYVTDEGVIERSDGTNWQTYSTAPLLGTKVYYVSDSSGGAVTRKLTFTNGILTSET